MKTDCELTLEVLQHAGSNGIHSFDLIRMVNSPRAIARICDLKKKGYSITSVSEKKGNAIGVRYFLNNSLITKPSYVLVDPMKDTRPLFQEAYRATQGVLL